MNKKNKESKAKKEKVLENYEFLEGAPAKIKELFHKEERTTEEEKELEEFLFGKANITYHDEFKWHSFLSLSKIRDYSSPSLRVGYKEWVGETAIDDVVVIQYSNLSLDKDGIMIGCGKSEIRARLNMKNIGKITSKVGQVSTFYPNMTIEKINQDLALEWVLPEGYFE